MALTRNSSREKFDDDGDDGDSRSEDRSALFEAAKREMSELFVKPKREHHQADRSSRRVSEIV